MAASAALLSTQMACAEEDRKSLTWNGITLYGNIDIGYAHQSHGTRFNDYYPQGLEYLIQKNSNGSVSALAQNGLSQSRIGLQGDYELRSGWHTVFNVETAFSPLSGKLPDGPRSLTQNNGVPAGAQSSNGDSSRAGQFFQGAAFVGIKSNTYGTATLGRQNGLLYDTIRSFDPLNASYAFSVIGASSATAGGGNTEYARLNSSVRYARKIGFARGGIQYQRGGGQNGGEAYEFDVGVDIDKLTIDANYLIKKSAISAASLTAAQVAALSGQGLSSDNALAATISDNTAYALGTRYEGDVYKAYAGYVRIRFANPSSPLGPDSNTIGGYRLAFINNAAYPNDKILEVTWIGLRYSLMPKVTLSGAYYRYDQNSYRGNGCNDSSSPLCGGELEALSLVMEYQRDDHFDFYAGAMGSKVRNGLASGYLHDSNVNVMAGVNFVF